jgi:hypothetical protein
MSTQSSLPDHEAAEEPDEDTVDVACETSLIDGGWETKEAAVFPPGYPRLCPHPECFGDLVPDEAWEGDGTADFDHNEHVDEFVRSTQRGHSRHMHRRDK